MDVARFKSRRKALRTKLRREYKDKKKLFAPEVSEEPILIDPVKVGVDTGRAKYTCPYKKPATIMLTRHQYYFEIKHKMGKRTS